MTEYSVEEVREEADGCGLLTRKRLMLRAYADLLERIKADESAVPVAQGEVVTEPVTDCNQLVDRMAFERWMVDVHSYPPGDLIWQEKRNCYADYGIHLAWQAWQEAAQPRAVPDGWSSAVSDALAVIKDVAQFHGQLPIGVYQHIQPRLAALLAAATSPGESA